VTSLSRYQSLYGLVMFVLIHVAHLVFSSTASAFLTNTSEKCKSASPSAIQVKNWRENRYLKEIKRNNSTWKRWTNRWLSVPQTVDVSYIFIALEIKNILSINVRITYRNVYILYTQYLYTLQFRISTNGIFIHYIRRGCHSRNPQ
jgi:hypothetical protein